MKLNTRFLCLGLAVFLVGLAGGNAAAAENASGGTYYTRFNIWYEHAEKILTTNYHKGAMLPIGTEVEIIKKGKKGIEFREKASGTKFKIVLVKKYTPLNETEFFDRYFSQENVLNSSEYKAFSSTEKDSIKEGAIREDMSKAAVIAAYGYPPTHRTPSIQDNVWTYWRSRVVNFTVQFRDDKATVVNL